MGISNDRFPTNSCYLFYSLDRIGSIRKPVFANFLGNSEATALEWSYRIYTASMNSIVENV